MSPPEAEPAAEPRRGAALRRAAILLAAALGVAACAQLAIAPGVEDEPPPAPRELRAAWVATVANIDWPSRKGLDPEAQRAEMRAILDRARALNLNAIFLQVRPSADAIYPSALEPWSEYLTGEQGRPPQPAWDPLQAWIDEAHWRGIELHAWFNPYRARHAKAESGEAPGHISRRRPELVRAYGAYLWLDPGEPEAARHTLEVVLDVVRRYDIDGVHFDDYFYPYPEKAPGGTAELDFPDEAPWRAYQARGGTLARADWRRENVNAMVTRVGEAVRREKPWLRYGISPFGIGRPDRRPAGIAGFSQYDKLYADVERWMAECRLDYLVPQLYWPIDQAAQAFGVLLDYWIAQNPCGRHVFAGLFTSRVEAAPTPWPVAEIGRQVDQARRRPGAQGHVHFSMAPLVRDRAGIVAELAPRYASPALVPAAPWLDATPPPAPHVNVLPPLGARGAVALRIAAGEGEAVARYAVWVREGGAWRFTVAPAAVPVFEVTPRPGARIDRVVVSAIDRAGNESARVAVAP